MKKIYSFYVLLFSLFFLVACGTTPQQVEEPDQPEPEPEPVAVVEPEPEPEPVVEEPEVPDIEPIAVLIPNPVPLEPVVPDIDSVFYFDFDKSTIMPQAYIALDQHAEVIKQAIAADPSVFVIIEGHCDERGSAEYNDALGQRRAEAVSRYLRVQGIPADSIETVSYGEWDPVDPAANEEAWAKNRRAVVIY